MFVVHGLGDITDHAFLEGALPSNLIRVSSDENRRDPMSHSNQMSMELNPRHSRHLNVGDQARRCGEERRCQKVGCRGERFDSVAQQTHEFYHGFAKGLIILDDRDQCRFRHGGFNFLGQHIPAPFQCLAPACAPYVGERPRQINARSSKRWLMRSAIRLGKRGWSCRRIVSRTKNIVAEEGALLEGAPLTQGPAMGDANPSVLIIDDDPEFRDSVGRLLRSVGLHTQQFSSVSDFLKADPLEGPTCLVLDIRMPGGSGLELQRDLAAANRQVPIIFITAHGDIPMTVQAMKGGAIEFLTKPFRDQDLLDAVEAGLARDRAHRESDRALGALRERFETLSSREREVMVQVTAGRLNKQIAHDIGIAESTVKVHRTNLMRKMQARSLPELSRMADILNLASERRRAPN
jgi:FixJ family two-component response regulator